MGVELDHLLVPSANARVAAEQLAELLGVPWADQGTGPFVPVFANEGLTLDFDQWDEPFPPLHFCFRVSETQFDAILQRLRAAGIAWRSRVHGPIDHQVDTEHGGRILYWNEPDGHQWEILTVSYARQGDAG